MTEEEWNRHLDYLDNLEISPFPITVGGSQHYGHGQVVPYLMVDLEEIIMSKESSELNDLQRAHLLQLYKSKLQQLGDDEFFNNFDEIREECYKQIGVSLPSIPFYVDPVHSAASTLGRQGGKVKSESKSSSSRSNGKKGGRPKSTKSLDMEDI